MGKIVKFRNLHYFLPRYFLQYIEESFMVRNVVSSDMGIQSVKETAKQMNGMTYDLTQFISWFMKTKSVPCSNYRLKINDSIYLSHYFSIFQDRFTGKYYYLGYFGGFHGFESEFLGILLRHIFDEYAKYHNVEVRTYELYKYKNIPVGHYDEDMVSSFIHEFGEKEILYENNLTEREATVNETRFQDFLKL